MKSSGNVIAALLPFVVMRCKISQKHHIENKEHKEIVRGTEHKERWCLDIMQTLDLH